MSFFRLSRRCRFEALVRPHLQSLYRLAYHLCNDRDSAEDLVQDVMTKLYPKTDELEMVEQLRPWLAKALYRQFVDQVRKRDSRPEFPLSVVAPDQSPLDYGECSPTPEPDMHLQKAQLRQTVQQALATLSADQRTLLVLHDVEGWRQEDIAAVLEIPLGTVKSRLHRSRSTLKERLKRKMEPFPSANVSG